LNKNKEIIGFSWSVFTIVFDRRDKACLVSTVENSKQKKIGPPALPTVVRFHKL